MTCPNCGHVVDSSQFLVTMQEVADYLGVHIKTAMDWQQNHGLPAAKIGGRIIATKSAVKAWVDERAKNQRPSG